MSTKYAKQQRNRNGFWIKLLLTSCYKIIIFNYYCIWSLNFIDFNFQKTSPFSLPHVPTGRFFCSIFETRRLTISWLWQNPVSRFTRLHSIPESRDSLSQVCKLIIDNFYRSCCMFKLKHKRRNLVTHHNYFDLSNGVDLIYKVARSTYTNNSQGWNNIFHFYSFEFYNYWGWKVAVTLYLVKRSIHDKTFAPRNHEESNFRT